MNMNKSKISRLFACTLLAGGFVTTVLADEAATASKDRRPAATSSQETFLPIRIKAGQSTPLTDTNGIVWEAERGFAGGDVTDRDPSTTIANTKDSRLYLSEHYAMDSFACDVPNGKYLAKLHFAETFDGISGPGERVFAFNVQGHEFKNFDVWAKAGGPNRAYVESVPVEVTDGKFKITFASNIENPMIN
ncbi:MAG: hypothetical protein EPO07_17610, partial [Verrucomicrobia bacterium]